MALIAAGRCAYFGTLEDASNVATIANAVQVDVDKMDKLKKYCQGENAKIATKPTSASPTMLDPGIVVSCSFGEKLVRTVFGYMFGKEWAAEGIDQADDDALAAIRGDRG